MADAAGLPGLGRIIGGLEPGAAASAFVEVPSQQDVQRFETAVDVTCSWLVGAGRGLERRSHIAVGYWTDGHTGHFEQDDHNASLS